MLKVKEVADVLNVSRPTVYSLISSGKLPCHRFETAIRVSQKDLDAYIKTSRTLGFPTRSNSEEDRFFIDV